MFSKRWKKKIYSKFVSFEITNADESGINYEIYWARELLSHIGEIGTQVVAASKTTTARCYSRLNRWFLLKESWSPLFLCLGEPKIFLALGFLSIFILKNTSHLWKSISRGCTKVKNINNRQKKLSTRLLVNAKAYTYALNGTVINRSF